MEPYASRHAGVVSAIRAIAWLESIRSKRAKHSIGGVDWSSHIGEGWPPRSQSSGVLALRCRYLSHPRERSESIGYLLTVFIKLPSFFVSMRYMQKVRLLLKTEEIWHGVVCPVSTSAAEK